jgi:hypothetical protein
MTLFEKICRMVGDRRIPSPRLPAFQMFRVGFANRHVSTVVVLAIVVSAAAVSVGLYFAIKDVASSTYNWPEPAEYQVTEAGLQTMGKKNEDYPDGSESQTLSIRLSDGARISTLRINATHLGRVGIDKAFDISPLTNGVTGSKAFLFVGNLTITDSSFPSFRMENSQVANLVTGLKCDGHTMAATVLPSVPEQVLSSRRLSSEYLVDNSVVDRVQIHITGSSGAYVDQLILSGVKAHTGSLSLGRMKIGTATMGSSNLIGDGSGIDDPSCIYDSSTEIRNLTNSITDTPILVQ